MSIDIILIIIVIGLLILISIISNHIEHRLDTIESRLIRLNNDVKYLTYCINEEDKDIDNTNDKDIKVVIYGNGHKVYEWRD